LAGCRNSLPDLIGKRFNGNGSLERVPQVVPLIPPVESPHLSANLSLSGCNVVRLSELYGTIVEDNSLGFKLTLGTIDIVLPSKEFTMCDPEILCTLDLTLQIKAFLLDLGLHVRSIRLPLQGSGLRIHRIPLLGK